MGHGSDLCFAGGMGRPRHQRMRPQMLSQAAPIWSFFAQLRLDAPEKEFHGAIYSLGQLVRPGEIDGPLPDHRVV